MPFPRINYCLICDSVRQEVGGKFSLLGFFGLTPNVDIGISKFGQPMLLSFVFGFGPVDDMSQLYSHQIQVHNPDGSILAGSTATPINTQQGKPGVLIYSTPVLPLVPGLRKITVVVNGEQVFEDHFMIRLARPDELGWLGKRPQ